MKIRKNKIINIYIREEINGKEEEYYYYAVMENGDVMKRFKRTHVNGIFNYDSGWVKYEIFNEIYDEEK